MSAGLGRSFFVNFLFAGLLATATLPAWSQSVPAGVYGIAGRPATSMTGSFGADLEAIALSNQAVEYLKIGRYAEGESLLKSAFQRSPNHPLLHLNYGYVLSRTGRAKMAIPHLQYVVAAAPACPTAYLNLGAAYQHDGNIAAAILMYQQFIDRFPQEPDRQRIGSLIKSLSGELPGSQTPSVASGLSGDTYIKQAVPGGTATRWAAANRSLKVFINPSLNQTTGGSRYADVLQGAFRVWENTGLVRFEFVQDPGLADIECKWSMLSQHDDSASKGGQTATKHISGKLSHATITIASVDPAALRAWTTSELQALSLHEVGHALGLQGHSPDPNDVMYCTVSGVKDSVSLSHRDRDTLRALYN